jgi:hypothetical protein
VFLKLCCDGHRRACPRSAAALGRRRRSRRSVRPVPVTTGPMFSRDDVGGLIGHSLLLMCRNLVPPRVHGAGGAAPATRADPLGRHGPPAGAGSSECRATLPGPRAVSHQEWSTFYSRCRRPPMMASTRRKMLIRSRYSVRAPAIAYVASASSVPQPSSAARRRRQLS